VVSILASDPFTYFFLLLVGLLLVAALCTDRNRGSPPRVDVRGVGRLPARLSRVESRVPLRLSGLLPGHTRDGGIDTPGLEVYARQFEAAIECIRPRRLGLPCDKGGRESWNLRLPTPLSCHRSLLRRSQPRTNHSSTFSRPFPAQACPHGGERPAPSRRRLLAWCRVKKMKQREKT
jgi:hypothetical protein